MSPMAPPLDQTRNLLSARMWEFESPRGHFAVRLTKALHNESGAWKMVRGE